MFQHWFYSANRSQTCSFQDLALININDIITHLIYDKQLSLTSACISDETCSIEKEIETITQQTMSIAEAIAQQYIQKANHHKQKILNNREKVKKPPTVDTLIDAKENRQINIIQRVPCTVEHQVKALSQQKPNQYAQQH